MHADGERRRTARPVLVAILAAVLAIAANTAYTSWAIHHAQQQAATVSMTAQKRGDQIERNLCLSLNRLAALKPPSGNPHTNPSRAYLQGEHAVLAQLGPDIRCPR